MTEDEMVGWHHQPDRHGFEQAPRVGDEQASLACCSPWDHKKLDTTEQLNFIELIVSEIEYKCSVLHFQLKPIVV